MSDLSVRDQGRVDVIAMTFIGAIVAGVGTWLQYGFSLGLIVAGGIFGLVAFAMAVRRG